MDRKSGFYGSTFMSGGSKVLNHSGSGSEVALLHRCTAVPRCLWTAQFEDTSGNAEMIKSVTYVHQELLGSAVERDGCSEQRACCHAGNAG